MDNNIRLVEALEEQNKIQKKLIEQLKSLDDTIFFVGQKILGEE